MIVLINMLHVAAASLLPLRWDEPGGRRSATWLRSCAAPTRSFRSVLDFLERDHGHSPLRLVPGSTCSDVIREQPTSREQRWVLRRGWVAPVRLGAELVELLKPICQWNGGVPAGLNDASPLPVAFRSGGKHGSEVWGLYFPPVWDYLRYFTRT